MLSWCYPATLYPATLYPAMLNSDHAFASYEYATRFPLHGLGLRAMDHRCRRDHRFHAGVGALSQGDEGDLSVRALVAVWCGVACMGLFLNRTGVREEVHFIPMNSLLPLY